MPDLLFTNFAKAPYFIVFLSVALSAAMSLSLVYLKNLFMLRRVKSSTGRLALLVEHIIAAQAQKEENSLATLAGLEKSLREVHGKAFRNAEKLKHIEKLFIAAIRDLEPVSGNIHRDANSNAATSDRRSPHALSSSANTTSRIGLKSLKDIEQKPLEEIPEKQSKRKDRTLRYKYQDASKN